MQARLLRLPLLLLFSAFASKAASPACAACHPQVAAKYAQTGMARAFYKPPATESARFYHKLSDTWYAMDTRAGQLYQRRWRIGPGGKEIETQEARVDYVMGSGNHVRTYLTRTERGALIELPLAWYSEGGGKWAMNPGHDRDYALPPRAVAYECMFCHNSYPQIPKANEEPGSEALYTGDLPEGIGCERCHGSGEQHVRAAQSGAKPEDIRKAIVNPARLPRDRQMEVCYQCHLETTSLQLPHSIVKYNRQPFSYQPGAPLSDFILFFDHARGSKYKDDFEIAHSAYRLRKSRCFLESKMTCLTCHDPHDIPRGPEAAAHYNAVCGQCHAQLASSHPKDAPDCVSCHMPKRRTQDVINAVMTDHYIQRRPPPGDLLAPLSERAEFDRNQYQGEVVPYYPSPLPNTPENALYVAVAQVTQRSNLKTGIPRFAAEIAKQKPALPAFYIELAEAWLGAHNPRNAIPLLEEALRRKADSAPALVDLGDALTQTGQSQQAANLLTSALRNAPANPLLWYQLGIANGETAPLERAVSLDPYLADAWNLLGSSYANAGDFDRALNAWRSALRVEPDMPDAQGNLAHLFAAQRDYPAAEYYFARAVRLKPNDADFRVNYAVTLAALNKPSDARRETEAAIRIDPKSPDAHNFLGSLLARSNEQEGALREFEEAARLRPQFGLAHMNAAAILLSKGDAAAARRHLDEAAKDPDPGIRKRARQLLH